MALTYIGIQNIGAIDRLPASATPTTIALDSANDQAAWIFHCGRADGSTVAIEKVGVVVTATAGSVPNYTLSIQGVTSARKPDGTIKGGGSPASVVTSSFSAGYNEFSLANTYTPSAGEQLALVITNSAADAGNNITIATGYTANVGGAAAQGGPFGVESTDGGSNWAHTVTSQKCTAFGVRYNSAADTLYVPWCLPYDSIDAEVSGWISSGDPLYKGSLWTPEYGCRLIGARMVIRVGDTSDFNVKLFEGSNTTPVLTRTVEGDVGLYTSGGFYIATIGLGPYTLAASTAYRLVVQPTTTNAFSGCFSVGFASDEALTSSIGKIYKTTSPSSISWTDYDNGGDGYAAFPVCPVIDQIDVAASGGLLVHPGMSGGMRG